MMAPPNFQHLLNKSRAVQKVRPGSTRASGLFRHTRLIRRTSGEMAAIILDPRDMKMRSDPSRSIGHGVASTLMSMLFVTWAAAQSPKFSNVDLCNGKDVKSLETQIIGCTALIKSDVNNSHVLSIALQQPRKRLYWQGRIRAGHSRLRRIDQTQIRTYAKPFNNRGVAYQKKGEYERAIEDFDAAIKIDPNYADAFANRAETYQKMADYPRALKDFDEAIRLQPTLGVTWNERCWTRAITGELQAALADCNEAIRLSPNLAAAFDSRGFTYLKLGQWEFAIDDYNSALRLQPKLPSALYGRGFAKLKRGDLASGNADIATAKTIDPNIDGDFARYGLH